jgi:hypothetical protein
MKKRIFFTDDEFKEIFTEEVIKATRALDKYAKWICRTCGGKCCKAIWCGFYSEKFDSCPIYEYRPLKCRLYYCKEITENEDLTLEEKELLDKRVKNLSETIKSRGIEIFFESPVKIGQKRWLTSLEMEEDAYKIVQAFEKGEINQETAKDSLKSLVRRYREGL